MAERQLSNGMNRSRLICLPCEETYTMCHMPPGKYYPWQSNTCEEFVYFNVCQDMGKYVLTNISKTEAM